MGEFLQMMSDTFNSNRPMVIIASLPQNDPALAQAALDGGADVVKFHINVHHHASQTHFGSLAEERKNIEQILKIWKGKPCGVVPGQTSELEPGALQALYEMGVDFVSLYLSDAPAEGLLPRDQMERMIALSYRDEHLAAVLDDLPIDVCEMSIMHPDTYAQPLTFHDLARYAAVAEQTDLPLIAPTQHRFGPEALPLLYDVGVDGVMIGVIAAGNTPQSWRESIRAFRKAADVLKK